MSENNSFEYTYSAAQKNEIQSILKKYDTPKEEKSDRETMLEELRKLDQSTSRPGMIAGLTMGILGTLILGGGMSMVMVGPSILFYPGILIGVAGMVIALAAYPLCKKITAKQKEKNAPRIIELSQKLLEEEI
ncbi:MAG: hypothetical protein IJW67_04360 [Blautia sp.]|nr:hypothetical protein [Blautia sp.]